MSSERKSWLEWFSVAVGVLVLALPALSWSCLDGSAKKAAWRPHIVVVLVDTLRADRIGATAPDGPLTPHLDALAREGVSLEAYSTSTWTKPAITSLFTGLHPSQHGIGAVAVRSQGGIRTEVLSRRFRLISEELRRAGYATGAFVNQVHLDPRFGFGQGFDRYRWERGVDAFELNRLLVTWAGGIAPQRLFGYVHYLDPHWPYRTSLPDQVDRFGSLALSSAPPRSRAAIEAWIREESEEDRIEVLRRRYDLEVAFVDAAVGELVADLERLDLWEDTVLVVTSDHGEAFDEHGKLLHGSAPYDELWRIPLVIRLPKRLRPHRSLHPDMVSLLDLPPTILEWARASPGRPLPGRSLTALLDGRRPSPRPIFADSLEARAVRTREHKLIRFLDGREEFYDLERDPQESQPLPCDERCVELRGWLDEYLLLGSSAGGQPPATVPIEGQRRLLEALGYL